MCLFSFVGYVVREWLGLIPNAFNGQPKIYMSNSFQKP